MGDRILDPPRRLAADRGMRFLLSRGGDRGIEPTCVCLDDGTPLAGPDLRSAVWHRIGVDIGVDPADEAFSAMMALALLRPPQSAEERCRLSSLRRLAWELARTPNIHIYTDLSSRVTTA